MCPGIAEGQSQQSLASFSVYASLSLQSAGKMPRIAYIEVHEERHVLIRPKVLKF